MATFNTGRVKSKLAGADLSAKQYFIVKQDTADDTVVLASAASDFLLGVLQNAPKQGELASVAVRSGQGTFKVVCGGSVTRGAKLTSDSNGKAVVTTNAGDHIIGYALQAGDASDVIEFMLSADRV